MKILVTRAAGFIGSNWVKAIFKQLPDSVDVGNINDYHDVCLKDESLVQLEQYSDFKFVKGNIVDRKLIRRLLSCMRGIMVRNSK